MNKPVFGPAPPGTVTSNAGSTVRIAPWQAPFDTGPAVALRRRLLDTRWSDQVAPDWSYGTAEQPLRQLVQHWQSGYDWELAAARLNGLPHFRAEIDGFGIHFLHFKARGATGQPLLLMNGWPSSFVEYTKLAAILADPASHGGQAGDAFDVVMPAHPGFGYSDRPGAPDQAHSVDLFLRLMTDGLGYASFIASGTDIGAGVATRMALKYPDQVCGIHISAVIDPPLTDASPPLSELERDYVACVARWHDQEGAYAHVQSTRPQTLAYALNDSPLGLASWILEKFHRWGDTGPDLFAVFPADMLLDNLNIYWSTQTIGASLRYYYEARHFRTPFIPADRVHVPTAICVWPKDLVRPPEEWARRFYNVCQYRVQARGGHFPAWEQPRLYADDLWLFLKTLRERGAIGMV
ncbi:MAG: epoxide hydrolase family protein [Pseudomonadota bacterium]